jgi:alpha-methylacyl-CoA racemase
MLPSFRAVALVTNIPGPLAAAALARDGAAVVKVEPLQGDPFESAAPAWYAQAIAGTEVVRLDLKAPGDLARLHEAFGKADVLLTAMRAGALQRLGLDWAALHGRYPRLCHVAIAGESAAADDRPGHDLTYQAQAGLVDPPAMPRSLFADLFAAERAVAAVYRALFVRERAGEATFARVAIADGAAQLAFALRHGLTTREGPLGGALPIYRLYEARDGWIALAALESHFQTRLLQALELNELNAAALAARFAERPCVYWEDVARRFDLPLCAVAKI